MRSWMLRRLIGNTPLLVITCNVRGRPRTVYAKCEQFNLTGSIKDRMALHILERACQEGRLGPGDTIVEASSGNTGISFAAIGRALGHPVTVFMPDWLSRERRDLMTSFGATVIPVSAEEGGFLGSIRRSEDMAARDPHVFLPAQFSNDANPGAHETSTGPEILEQLSLSGRVPDAFVAGVGTGVRSWAWGAAFARGIPRCAFTRWSPRNRRRYPRAARTVATGSRASRTSSFRRWSGSASWMRSCPFTTAMRS